MKTNVLEIISAMGEGGAESLVKDYGLLIDKNRFNIQILTVYNVRNSTTVKQLIENDIKVDNLLPGYNLMWKLFKWLIGFIYIPIAFYRVIKIIFNDAIICKIFIFF